MSFDKIACVHSGAPLAEQGFRELSSKYPFVPVDQADVVVALGGDGLMLQTLHQLLDRHDPLPGATIYGMNRGTVGFLLNEYCADELPERLESAKSVTLYPLRMTATDSEGQEHTALAFNEVALVRYSQQSANIAISVNGKKRMERLVSDGVMVATPAGSTAYNLSAHGPVVPLTSNLLALTPVSPFRPRRWPGALLSHDAIVEFTVLDPDKRPVGASADSREVRRVVKVRVTEDRSRPAVLLFDPGRSLEERVFQEQFSC